MIRTVTRDILPQDLGVTLMHEHVLVDYAKNFEPPEDGTSRAALGGMHDREERMKLWERPMASDIAGHCRCYFSSNRDNMILNGMDTMVDEIGRYRQIGGSTIVECSTPGIGRNPLGLKRLSERTGINIVMSTGFYLARVHPSGMSERSAEDISALFVQEITSGVEVDDDDGDGGIVRVRAGLIGELGCTTDLQPTERVVLRAAAMAQGVTGASISIHPGYSRTSPSEVLDVLEASGADLSRVVMGHVDRGILTYEDMTALATRGCTLEFDQFGWDSSYVHALAYNISYPSDFERCKTIKRLVDEGYGDRIVISHDLAFKTRLTRFGGTGYDYINRNVVPYLIQQAGLSPDDVHHIQVDTPRRILTLPLDE